MDNKIIYIQTLQGNAVDRTAKFSQDNIIIGSGPAAHLRLEDHRVSRIHAMIKFGADGNLLLSDLGWSDEGTLLNGIKINEERVLSEGSQIQLGETFLRVFTNPPGEQVAPPAAAVAPPSPQQQPQGQGTAQFGNFAPQQPVAPVAIQQPVAPVAIQQPVAPVAIQQPVAPVAVQQPVAPMQYGTENLAANLNQAPLEAVISNEPLPAPPAQVEAAYQPQAVSQQPAQAQIQEPAFQLSDEPTPLDQLPAYIKKDMVEDDTRKGKSYLQVAFQWQGTTVDIGTFEEPREVTVGPHPLNDFAVSDETFPDKTYPLVIPHSGGFGVFFTSQFQGSIYKANGSAQSINDIRSSLPLKNIRGIQGHVYVIQAEERLVLEAKELQIQFQLVYPTAPYVTAAYRNWDYLYWRIMAFSAITHFAMVLMFQFVPNPEALNEQLLKGRFAKLIAVPPPKPPKRREEKFKLKKKKKKKKKQKVKKVKTKATKRVKRSTNKNVSRKQRDMNRIKKSGLVGLLSQGMGTGGPGGSLFGKMNNNKLLSNVLGASSTGGGFGMSGVGKGGFGLGGGGGSGAYSGGGGGFGYGGKKAYGRKGMKMRGSGRKKRRVRVSPGRLFLKGALSKAQIARVIRMYWFQIKYCYERQLRKNPKLAGKIVIRWIIGGSGSVQTANVTQTTMGNERVENCIVRRILRWKFPQPKGGGIVVVNYPFLFTVSG